jgi:uncharacterized protein (DUF58 family)
MADATLERAFLFGALGLCLLLGPALGASALTAMALAGIALLLAARTAAARRLGRLRVRRSTDGSAFEDEETRVEVLLENHGRAPIPLVEVTDTFGPALSERQALLEAGPLGGGRRRRLSYRTVCSRLWGVHLIGPLTVSVSDPLGLFSPRRVFPDIQPFDVFPRVHPMAGLDRLGSRQSFVRQELTAGRAGQSATYLGVRDYRPGDDVRRIHWPATARRGAPAVKEFEVDLTPYFTLFLDLHRAHRAGTGQKSTLEYVVRTAASLLASAARRGDVVQGFGEWSHPLFVPPGRGELHLAHALDQLIRVHQDGATSLLDVLEREGAGLPHGSTAALLSATAFLDLGRLAEALGALRARRVQAALVAVDKDSFLQIESRSRPPEEVQAQVEELLAMARSHGVAVAVLSADQDLEREIGRPGWLEPA